MSKIVKFSDYTNKTYIKTKKDAFDSALDLLSKQNGVSYEKMLLGTNTEKKIERTKLNAKMEITKKEIELMEG